MYLLAYSITLKVVLEAHSAKPFTHILNLQTKFPKRQAYYLLYTQFATEKQTFANVGNIGTNSYYQLVAYKHAYGCLLILLKHLHLHP